MLFNHSLLSKRSVLTMVISNPFLARKRLVTLLMKCHEQEFNLNLIRQLLYVKYHMVIKNIFIEV